MSLSVRYAKREELERVNELRRMVNELHAENRPDIFLPGFCEGLQQHIYQVFDTSDSDVVVACKDGIICGFAIVEYIDRPQSPYMYARRFYHIQEFGVDAAFRRCGVATALIDFCRSEAKRMQFERMELDVWAFNADAIKFYEAMGFQTYRSYMEVKI